MSRGIRITLVLAAVAALAIAGVASAAVSPSSGGQTSKFKITVKGSSAANGAKSPSFLEAVLKAPRGASAQCRWHHAPSPSRKGSGSTFSATFTLDPNDLYSHKWCKGSWKV